MAREESERDELLREATALVERIELRATSSAHDVEAQAAHIVIDFPSNHAVSIFFGGDPVYQFNNAGELRRAFCDGRLFKAVRGRLVSLRRVRQPNEVQLRSHDLTDVEQSSFILRMQNRLRDLATDLESGRYCIVGQVPRDVDVLGRTRRSFAVHDGTPIAATPRA